MVNIVSFPIPVLQRPATLARVLRDGDSVALDISNNGVDWLRIGTIGSAFALADPDNGGR